MVNMIINQINQLYYQVGVLNCVQNVNEWTFDDSKTYLHYL